MSTELKKFSVKEATKLFAGPWDPKDLVPLGDRVFRVAEFLGTYGNELHAHEYDEFFLVLDGCIEIRTAGETLELETLEGVVVPAGIDHQPYAKNKALVLMLDKE
ncbi:MAG: cupin domain-containing protein [bacterium]|nr:cupin domain-containing protein [bacterium]